MLEALNAGKDYNGGNAGNGGDADILGNTHKSMRINWGLIFL